MYAFISNDMPKSIKCLNTALILTVSWVKCVDLVKHPFGSLTAELVTRHKVTLHFGYLAQDPKVGQSDQLTLGSYRHTLCSLIWPYFG